MNKVTGRPDTCDMGDIMHMHRSPYKPPTTLNRNIT